MSHIKPNANLNFRFACAIVTVTMRQSKGEAASWLCSQFEALNRELGVKKLFYAPYARQDEACAKIETILRRYERTFTRDGHYRDENRQTDQGSPGTADRADDDNHRAPADRQGRADQHAGDDTRTPLDRCGLRFVDVGADCHQIMAGGRSIGVILQIADGTYWWNISAVAPARIGAGWKDTGAATHFATAKMDVAENWCRWLDHFGLQPKEN